MSDEAKSEPTPEPTEKKGRKRREKPAPMTPVALPGEGTPDGELLRDANAAFDAGNYARVRELGTQLAKASDPKVADAAADLVRRVSLDPVQLIFLTACLCALVAITYIYIL